MTSVVKFGPHVFLTSLLLLITLNKVISLGCSLNITNGTAGANTPVILSTKGHELTLTVPKNGTIHFNKSSELILVCPGPKNKILNTDSKDIEATCSISNTIQISQSFFSFDHLQCLKPVQAEIKDPGTQCGNIGKEILIGYQLRSIKHKDFVKLIKVCYDEHAAIPLYTEHVIHGEAVKFGAKSSVRPSFSTLGLGDVAAMVAYTKRFQKSTFNSLLGSTVLADKYINHDSSLAKGHLAPHGDFPLTSSQRSSYFYINACPQWQAINNGNWKRVESAIRKTAESRNKTYIVLTGTYGVLTLKNGDDKPVEIYLHKKVKLPVPKYTWKVLYDPGSRSGIAMVVYNNPFGKSTENIEFCQNICKDYGWERESWYNIKKGYVFCCEVNEFREVVNYVPVMEVNKVLRGVF